MVNADKTYAFLAGFFGFTDQEVRARFSVVEGEKDTAKGSVDAALPFPLVEACIALGASLTSAAGEDLALVATAISGVESTEGLGIKLTAACLDDAHEKLRALALGSFAKALFPALPHDQQEQALSGLLRALADAKGDDLPRFRFHWMARSVDGIWASLDASTANGTADPWRTVGRLSNECGQLLDAGNRVLESLYCDCCGTLFVAGYRCEAPGRKPLPGQPPSNGIELLPTSPRLENLPGGFSESMTDRLTWKELAVFWPCPRGEVAPARGLDEPWLQAKSRALAARQGYGYLVAKTDRGEARWQRACLNPQTALLRPLDKESVVPNGWIEGYYFEVPAAMATLGDDDCPAMPHVCPYCATSYSHRRGRLSPIRTFRTGLNKLTQILSKHLFLSLPQERPRLVAFSDSREAAAVLANGVEGAHWVDMLRTQLFNELLGRSSDPAIALRAKLLSSWEAAKAAGATLEKLATLTEELWDSTSEPSGQAALSQCHDWIADAEADLASMPSFQRPAAERSRDLARDELAKVKESSRRVIRLDDFLGGPGARLFFDFSSLGICPAGNDLSKRRRSMGNAYRWWNYFFEEELGAIRKGLTLDEEAEVSRIRDDMRRHVLRALFGRIIYDLESHGIGHVALSAQGANPRSEEHT